VDTLAFSGTGLLLADAIGERTSDEASA
jgi:hypothetical protein